MNNVSAYFGAAVRSDRIGDLVAVWLSAVNSISKGIYSEGIDLQAAVVEVDNCL